MKKFLLLSIGACALIASGVLAWNNAGEILVGLAFFIALVCVAFASPAPKSPVCQKDDFDWHSHSGATGVMILRILAFFVITVLVAAGFVLWYAGFHIWVAVNWAPVAISTLLAATAASSVPRY